MGCSKERRRGGEGGKGRGGRGGEEEKVRGKQCCNASDTREALLAKKIHAGEILDTDVDCSQ